MTWVGAHTDAIPALVRIELNPALSRLVFPIPTLSEGDVNMLAHRVVALGKSAPALEIPARGARSEERCLMEEKVSGTKFCTVACMDGFRLMKVLVYNQLFIIFF